MTNIDMTKKLRKQLSIYTQYKFAYNHFKLTIIRVETKCSDFSQNTT